MLKVISSVIVENRENFVETLNSHQLLPSLKNICNSRSVSEEFDLSSNQEEADTKIPLHCHHAL
jgi:hypothetical protein